MIPALYQIGEHRGVSSEYKQHLKSPYWQKCREKVLERDGYHCCICGSERNLEIHHIWGKNRFHELDHLEDLMTLCSDCHARITAYYFAKDVLKNKARKG